MLEGVCAGILTGKRAGRILVLQPDEVQIIRTEGPQIVAYGATQAGFLIEKRLYELETLLGPQFIRISKSAMVKIRQIDHVDVGFNGMLDIVMKNGLDEYISRRYVGDFKKRLGL